MAAKEMCIQNPIVKSQYGEATNPIFEVFYLEAVSYTHLRPIVDIQQFITENICDIPDKPDIEAMQQDVYKRQVLLMC